MKILLVSVGTQGDMEPCVAIGELLKESGHRVICAFPEQFQPLAEDSGLEFFSLGPKYIELLNSKDGKLAMGGGKGFQKFMGTLRLAVNQGDANKELVQKQYEIVLREQPDRIVYNGKSMYPLIWEIKNPGKTVFLSPLPYMHYVEGHSHVAFNANMGTFLNKLSFSLAHFGMVTTAMIAKKWLKIKDDIKRKDIREILKKGKSIYTISPALFQRPTHWLSNLQVVGYFSKKISGAWYPDEGLENFINRHGKVLFITFGSMINSDPEEKTRIILEILERNKIPAIINTASGGLIKPEDYDPELIQFIERVPYDWIFPKIFGVIHHGGSGTTHLALKYGCASMIVPHIIDQFVWNNIVADLGVGPKGMKISKIGRKHFETSILELLNNPAYKHKAEEIKTQMAQEDYKDNLLKCIID